MADQLQDQHCNVTGHSTEDPMTMTVVPVHPSTVTTMSLKDDFETQQTIEEQFEAELLACGLGELECWQSLIRRYKEDQYMLASILATIKALPIGDDRRDELRDAFSNLSESSFRSGDVGSRSGTEERDAVETGTDGNSLEQHITGDLTRVEQGMEKLDLARQDGFSLDCASIAESDDIETEEETTVKNTKIEEDTTVNNTKTEEDTTVSDTKAEEDTTVSDIKPEEETTLKNTKTKRDTPINKPAKVWSSDKDVDHAAHVMPGWYESFCRLLWARAIMGVVG